MKLFFFLFGVKKNQIFSKIKSLDKKQDTEYLCGAPLSPPCDLFKRFGIIGVRQFVFLPFNQIIVFNVISLSIFNVPRLHKWVGVLAHGSCRGKIHDKILVLENSSVDIGLISSRRSYRSINIRGQNKIQINTKILIEERLVKLTPSKV